MLEIFVIVIGRFVGTVGLLYFLKLFKHEPKTTFRQTIFIYYAGSIRGAIAFGLVLSI